MLNARGSIERRGGSVKALAFRSTLAPLVLRYSTLFPSSRFAKAEGFCTTRMQASTSTRAGGCTDGRGLPGVVCMASNLGSATVNAASRNGR